jgi:hypothetical protein
VLLKALTSPVRQTSAVLSRVGVPPLGSGVGILVMSSSTSRPIDDESMFSLLWMLMSLSLP